MAHDCLVSIRTVPGCIGVGEAIKGVAVAGFDGVNPRLFDRKAQAGMIETNKGTNAGEIKAAWVKWGTCGMGGQGNSLGCTVQVVDQAGDPRHVGGKDALAGMRVCCRRHGWWNDHWGRWGQSCGAGSGEGVGMGDQGAVALVASWGLAASVVRGKCQRRGPVSSRQPERIGWLSGRLTVTVVCVKTIVQSWLANGPKPMRVWGKLCMTCPNKAVGGRAVADARVALATKCSGQPLAMRTPTVGAWGLKLATGASGTNQ